MAREDLWVPYLISSKHLLCDWIPWPFATSEAYAKFIRPDSYSFFRAHSPDSGSPNLSIFCNLNRLRIFQSSPDFFCLAVLPSISFLYHFTLSCEMKPVSPSSFGLEISSYIHRKAYFPHVYRLNFAKISAMISVFGIHISTNKLLQAMKTFSIILLKILPTTQFLSQF